MAEIVGGGTPDTNNINYWNGDIDWYSPTEIGKEIYVSGSLKKISQLGLEKSSAKLLPRHKTILFTSRASIGDMAILLKSGTTNQGFQSFVINESKANVYFVYSLGFKIKNFALQNATGSTFLEISKKQLEKTPFSLPSLPEQKRIGDFFKSLDSLITLHKRKLDNIKELKKSLLQNMFVKDNQTTPKIRFPNFTHAWEKCRLGDVAHFKKGSGYSKKDLTQTGTPVILYGRLYTDYKTSIDNIDTFAREKNGCVLSVGGEVITPASGESADEIACASVVERAGVILGGDLNIIKLNEKIFPIFLALLISNGRPKLDLIKKAQGKSVVHIKNSDLASLVISFPSLPEQKRIGEFFKSLDSLITLHKRQCESF